MVTVEKFGQAVVAIDDEQALARLVFPSTAYDSPDFHAACALIDGHGYTDCVSYDSADGIDVARFVRAEASAA